MELEEKSAEVEAKSDIGPVKARGQGKRQRSHQCGAVPSRGSLVGSAIVELFAWYSSAGSESFSRGHSEFQVIQSSIMLLLL